MLIVLRSFFHKGNKYQPKNFLGECLYKLQLKLYKIYVSEGIDVDKTNVLGECIICHYWDFLEISFGFQLKVFNVCHHDLIQIKLWVLMMLHLFLIKQMIIEFNFGI